MISEIHYFQKITMGWSCSLNRKYQNNKKLFNWKFYGKRTVGRPRL